MMDLGDARRLEIGVGRHGVASEHTESEDKTWVGARMPRVEDGPLLKGRGGYVDDLPVKKGTLEAAILRSPHPHAWIRSIDVSEALRQPGVKSIMTGADLARHAENFVIGFETPPMDYRGMAIDKVRYVGEPVAVVCATDRYKAEDALDFIRVEYEPVEAVIDPVAAEQPGAPILHDAAGTNVMLHRTFTHGEPAAAFAAAAHETEFTIRYPRNSITPMETYAVVAEYLPDARSFDVISNFQGPFSLHPVMARSLGVQGSKLRHRSPPNSGGSFGSKLTLFPYIVVMCVAAKLAGRPVKWIEDRLEHLSAANSAPNRVSRVRAAYDGEGIVSAIELEHWDDNGAYLRAPMPAPIFRMHGVSTNGYGIPNVHVINHIMVTNKCPSGAVRGFGGPQLYFAVERMMHRIATELGLDPLDVIRRNLIPADAFPYRAPAGALIDSGNYQEVVEKTVEEGQIISSGISANTGGTPIAVVANVSSFRVDANVDETDITHVQPGQSAQITLESGSSSKFRGTVDRILPKAELDSNVIILKVRVNIEGDVFGKAYPGMTATVKILVNESKDALLVPTAAVKQMKNRKVVYVPDGEGSKPIQVKTGLDNGEKTEIINGLHENDEVYITHRSLPTRRGRF